MAEVIVARDPVLLTLAWLRTHLDGVKVVKNRPAPLTGEFVVVRRTGGAGNDLVTDQAWLTAEVFAPSDLAASDLAHLSFGLLKAMAGEVIDGTQCYRVDTIARPADLPLTDPAEAQRPRYVMSVQAMFRASPVAA